jgi:hypothetical protein
VTSRNSYLLVYLPASFTADFASNLPIKEIERVGKPKQICKNVYVTGEMGTGRILTITRSGLEDK